MSKCPRFGYAACLAPGAAPPSILIAHELLCFAAHMPCAVSRRPQDLRDCSLLSRANRSPATAHGRTKSIFARGVQDYSVVLDIDTSLILVRWLHYGCLESLTVRIPPPPSLSFPTLSHQGHHTQCVRSPRVAHSCTSVAQACGVLLLHVCRVVGQDVWHDDFEAHIRTCVYELLYRRYYVASFGAGLLGALRFWCACPKRGQPLHFKVGSRLCAWLEHASPHHHHHHHSLASHSQAFTCIIKSRRLLR